MRWREIPLSAWVGMAGLAVAIGCAIFAPLIAPYSEREVVGDIWLPMGGDFLLGTDNLGRDRLSRLIYGAQTTITVALAATVLAFRSEEHTSELQSLMRISYAVFCLKKKQTKQHEKNTT